MKSCNVDTLIREAVDNVASDSKRQARLRDEKVLEAATKKAPRDKGLRSLLELRKFLNKNL